MPDPAETLLVLRAQAGDREAFEALLECVGEPLFGYLLQLTGERELARDLLQETLLTIYRKLLWLREPTLFRPWSYRIASRAAWKALGLRRREAGREELLEELAAQPPDEVQRLTGRQWAGEIQRLPPASRTVLTLHYLHEMSLEEVAAVLEIPLGTAKSRLAYGLNRLRQRDPERRAP